MVQKESYDFESKREYRRLLRDFIARQFPKEKQRRGLRYVCLPGHEGLEVLEVYDKLGIPRHRGYGIEHNPEAANQLRVAVPGLNVYQGEAEKFFEDEDVQFDVVNLDFQGHLKDEEKKILHEIFERRRNKSRFVLGTNFFGSRETSERKEYYMKNVFGYWSRGFSRLPNNTPLGSDHFFDFSKPFTSTPSYIPDFVRDRLFSGNLESLREESINSFIGGLIFGLRADDIIKLVGPSLDEQLHTLGLDANKVRTNPFDYYTELRIIGLLNIDRYNKCFRNFFPKLSNEDADQLTSYLLFSQSTSPLIISDFYKGKYISDSGAPMIFDFLTISNVKGKFGSNPLKVQFDETGSICINVKNPNELYKKLASFFDLVSKSDRYLFTSRKEVVIKTLGDKIREDLEAGLGDDEIRTKHGLEARVSLAGHKAALTRAKNGNGYENGSGKINGNGKVEIEEGDREVITGLITEGYKATEIAELFDSKYTWQSIAAIKGKETRVNGNGKQNGNGNDEVYSFLADPEFSDDDIKGTFGLTDGQLRAKKAVLTRMQREESGVMSYSTFRDLILLRDRGTCQYPDCGITNEQHLEKDGTSLHVHHIDYNHDNNQLDNGIALCSNHHAMTNLVQHADRMRDILEDKVLDQNSFLDNPEFKFIFANVLMSNLESQKIPA